MENLDLTPKEIERYHRQMILPQVGRAGQEAIKRARVLIVGMGGLGCPTALYLAAAGVGRLGLVDFDRVEATNLHRQILYTMDDVGQPKALAARKRLSLLNPSVNFDVHELKLDPSNALSLMENYDIVVDGSDNFATRYLVNDACTLLGRPLVFGSVHQFHGQVAVFFPPKQVCYRCLYPNPPAANALPNCSQGGVFGVLPGMIGTMQATEALKIILGLETTLLGKLLLVDGLTMDIRQYQLPLDEACLHFRLDSLSHLGPLFAEEGAGKIQCQDDKGVKGIVRMTPQEIKSKLDLLPMPNLKDEILLLDVRTAQEGELVSLDNSHRIPLQVLGQRWQELVPWKNKEIIIYCHHGIRSMMAARLLQEKGFTKLINLDGGIDEWALTVDPALDRY